jgi:hypothetical protein
MAEVHFELEVIERRIRACKDSAVAAVTLLAAEGLGEMSAEESARRLSYAESPGYVTVPPFWEWRAWDGPSKETGFVASGRLF